MTVRPLGDLAPQHSLPGGPLPLTHTQRVPCSGTFAPAVPLAWDALPSAVCEALPPPTLPPRCSMSPHQSRSPNHPRQTETILDTHASHPVISSRAHCTLCLPHWGRPPRVGTLLLWFAAVPPPPGLDQRITGGVHELVNQS